MDKQAYENIIAALLFTVVLLVGGYVLLASSIDNSIDNQNEMLCNSAKVSGNKEYLMQCQDYYKTGSIEYMRNK